MTPLRESLEQARATGDFSPVIAQIPYAQFLGFDMEVVEGDVVGTLRYGEHIVGNAKVDALHGGTIGALLESTAIFKILWEAETPHVPRTINITVEYLRTAARRDTYARASFTRHGRRVANVRIVAYQDDPARPVAAATAHFLIDPTDG